MAEEEREEERQRITDRMRLLVWQLGDEAGRPKRGWKAKVAFALDVHPSYVSRLLSETDFRVGDEVVERAMRTLGLSRRFFTAVELDDTAYTANLADTTDAFTVKDLKNTAFATSATAAAIEKQLANWRTLCDLVDSHAANSQADSLGAAHELLESAVQVLPFNQFMLAHDAWRALDEGDESADDATFRLHMAMFAFALMTDPVIGPALRRLRGLDR